MNIHDQVWDQLRSQARIQDWGQVCIRVQDQFSGQVWSQVWDQLEIDNERG